MTSGQVPKSGQQGGPPGGILRGVPRGRIHRWDPRGWSPRGNHLGVASVGPSRGFPEGFRRSVPQRGSPGGLRGGSPWGYPGLVPRKGSPVGVTLGGSPGGVPRWESPKGSIWGSAGRLGRVVPRGRNKVVVPGGSSQGGSPWGVVRCGPPGRVPTVVLMGIEWEGTLFGSPGVPRRGSPQGFPQGVSTGWGPRGFPWWNHKLWSPGVSPVVVSRGSQ